MANEAPSAPILAAAGATPLVALDRVAMVFTTHKGVFRSGTVTAVSGVDIAIARGETLALVGESGSGKTTVGRISLRLLEPTSGTVQFAGRDITHEPESHLGWLRRRAAIVFQDPFSSLNPYMTVGELIAEPLIIDGVRDADSRSARVRAAMEAVDLRPVNRFLHRYPSAMSGGQRQRAGIARALVREPEYIVADEPVSMVDASSRVEILNLLLGIQQTRGVTFLFITHDIASARHFADRIAVMVHGAIVETGTAAQIIDHPAHPYTRALIAAVPEPDPANRFRRRATERWQDAALDPIHPACPHQEDDSGAPTLLDIAGEPGHQVACHRSSRAAR